MDALYLHKHVSISENGTAKTGVVVDSNDGFCEIKLASGRCISRTIAEVSEVPLNPGAWVRKRGELLVGQVLFGETQSGEVLVAWFSAGGTHELEWIEAKLLIIGHVNFGAVFSRRTVPNNMNMQTLCVFTRPQDAVGGGIMLLQLYPVGIVPIEDVDIIEQYNAASAVLWACKPAQTREELEHAHLASPIMTGYNIVHAGHSAGLLNVAYSAAIDLNVDFHMRTLCPGCVGAKPQPLTEECLPCDVCDIPRMLFIRPD